MIFLTTLAIFLVLEYGQVMVSFNGLLQPVIFSSVVSMIFLFGKSRQIFLWISSILFSLMIVFYLAGSLFVSNWIGSLGMGILVILIFSYILRLIKNGHI